VIWIGENKALLLEIIAVIFGLAYIILAAKNKISCWFFGVISALLSIWLFIEYAQLYAEAFLYCFYFMGGFYGWYIWKNQVKESTIYQHSLKNHALLIIIGGILSVGFYYLVTNIFTDAARPLIDSFTTIFSFIATYLTIKKWLNNWIYWIAIDIVTTYLYFSRELYLYAGLMTVYAVIAIYGYMQWRKLHVVKIH
jgi:nicotinamide mononucleotide transporter